MILISINFHFLWISEYESMLVQAGSFRIPFSLLETVVKCIFFIKHVMRGHDPMLIIHLEMIQT